MRFYGRAHWYTQRAKYGVLKTGEAITVRLLVSPCEERRNGLETVDSGVSVITKSRVDDEHVSTGF